MTSHASSRLDRLIRLLWPVIGRPTTLLVERALASHALVGGSDPLLHRSMIYGDATRLCLDPTAVVNNALFNLSSGSITIGAPAFFGHGVVLLTGTHDLTKTGAERQRTAPSEGYDIVVGDGAWLSTNVTVVGPCTIGEHAVFGVGSLVLADVAPNTLVVGSPARYKATLPRPDPGPQNTS
ncbi:hypothetical protein BH18ACT4_BH18ACT4_15870 [soil metagenome]